MIGVGTPRTLSVNGGPLPSARTVSLGVFDGSTETTSDFTSLGVHFGQITDHDLSAVDGQQGGTIYYVPLQLFTLFSSSESSFHLLFRSIGSDISRCGLHV